MHASNCPGRKLYGQFVCNMVARPRLYQVTDRRKLPSVAVWKGTAAYAAAISRVALIGSFNTLQSAFKFASRGLT
jgi:hypothetical protein